MKTNRKLFQLCLLGSLLLGKIHYIQSQTMLKYAGNIVNKLKTDTLPKSGTLQQNANVAAPSGWTTSGYTISTSNGTNSITITPPTGNLFFSLSNP